MRFPQEREYPGGFMPASPVGYVPGYEPAYYDAGLVEAPAVKALKNRVDYLASHMQKQLTEHREAMLNTNVIFERLLQDMDTLAQCFLEAFAGRELNESRVAFEADADRSVGILKVLWHALSFTARGNSKPLALHRPGRAPVFTGRILALHGDFQDVRSNLQACDYPEILHYEVSSLYVPADPMTPAVMKIKHLGGEEHYFHQADAARMFLLKTIEVTCGGGFYHEHL